MQERWLKLIGIIFTLGMKIRLEEVHNFAFTANDTIYILLIITSVVLQWEVAHMITRIFRKLFSGRSQISRRFLVTLLCCIPALFLIEAGAEIVIHLAVPGEAALGRDRLLMIMLQSFFISFTCIGLFESGYYYSRFSKAELEKEELLRSNLLSQFESLKSQVNPHFLFNSLNSLSALIRKDPGQAEHYVEEMSNVYRYLLKSNEQELITLREELNYLQSFVHLLTYRYGAAFTVDINVQPEHLDFLVPPLTLQILVENAIKFNIVTREQPLEVIIFSTPTEKLHVVNNLQRKVRDVSSGKLGLSNIIGKYRLLNQPEMEVKDTGEEFIVILPLVKSDIHAGIHH